MTARPLLLLLAFSMSCASGGDKTDDTDTVDGADTDVADDTDVVDTDVADTDVVDTDVVDTDVAPSVGLTQGSQGISWADGTFATSCRAYRTPGAGYAYSGTTGDGAYLIDPDGVGGAAEFVATCDMTNDGGGWTLVGQATPIGDTNYSLCTTSAVGTLTAASLEVAEPAKLSDAVIDGIWAGGSHELRVLGDVGNADTVVLVWTTSCILDFANTQAFDSVSNGGWTLDGTTVDCADGQRTLNTAYAEADTCGYGYQMVGGSYMIWSYDPDYTLACNGATAGRSWPGSSGNNGCNTSKTWAR